MSTTAQARPLVGRRFTGFPAVMAFCARGLWRSVSTWVLVAIVAVVSVTSPIITHFTPEILSALLDPALAETLPVGTPTWEGAYADWVKNLNQTCLIAITVIAAMSLHSHLGGGTTALIITRNVGRSAYLSAHFAAFSAFLLTTQLVVSVATWAIAAAVFSGTSFGAFIGGGLVWWLFSILILSAMTCAEALTGSIGASLAVGAVVYLATTIGSIWTWGSEYTPLGLTTTMSALASDQGASVAPLVNTAAAIVILWFAATIGFEHKAIEN